MIGSGNNWPEQAKLTASSAAPTDLFGRAVAIEGDLVAIGAAGVDHTGALSGAAYLYLRTGSVWTEQAMLTASDAAASAALGEAVALSADSALVGAHYTEAHA